MGGSLTKPATESSVDRMTTLSKDIEEKTRYLTDALRSKGLDAPSYKANGLSDFPLTEVEAVRTRQELVALTKELHDLVLGPRETLKNMAWEAICEFKIAEAVPLTGSISYEELAIKVHDLTGTTILPSDLRRLMRLAIANNIFQEPKIGSVAHNRASLLLLEDESLASWTAFYTMDLLAPISQTVAAMKAWPGSQETNETAKSFFDHLQADEARARRYDLMLQSHGQREGYDVSHTVSGYPWAKLGKGTVVDMGGNEGFVAIALAEAFPSLSFVVQDLEGMRTPEMADKIPKHLANQISLTTHDFFQPQTETGDAYLFRHIFHAFSDKYAINILRALIPGLKPGARVIINDIVLPDPGVVSRLEEKSIRTMDVLMKAVCNSREREMNDWKSLFEQADKRFRWQGAWKTSGKLWFIESIWEP
ncbi:O-methyltransferase [Trichoderma gamsii]|uniref:O-methyltransferase n=1 Tax=Trichoderma gamsii TaxID=398673 RepID=A0A2P4ZTT6_9HYPO|nr:O-methyltransferase [Trichoderma gamsii]PON27705.1 O-methyltransferase [Trichoderma gamsii]